MEALFRLKQFKQTRHKRERGGKVKRSENCHLPCLSIDYSSKRKLSTASVFLQTHRARSCSISDESRPRVTSREHKFRAKMTNKRKRRKGSRERHSTLTVNDFVFSFGYFTTHFFQDFRFEGLHIECWR